MFPYELERGSRKHICPNCERKSFKRVVSTSTGEYLPGEVGRCDRAVNCGYSYKWSDYVKANADNQGIPLQGLDRKKRPRGFYTPRKTRQPDYIPHEYLMDTLAADTSRNSCIQFLNHLFDDAESVQAAIAGYRIGTYENWTCFPVIDATSRPWKLCKAKLMIFNPVTGKRRLQHSLEKKLKERGVLNDDFETNKNIFFGEQLIYENPDRPIGIVESEKSEIVASLCKDIFPGVIWIACQAGLSWLNAERIARLPKDRRIVLFPDTDTKGRCYSEWSEVAGKARRKGCDVQISDVLERHATDDKKADGADLADYLIRERLKRKEPVKKVYIATLPKPIKQRSDAITETHGPDMFAACIKCKQTCWPDTIGLCILCDPNGTKTNQPSTELGRKSELPENLMTVIIQNEKNVT